MRVAINGCGRIGKAVLKLCLDRKINVVALNDLHGVKDAAYLIKYDSIYGVYDKEVKIKGDNLIIGNKKIKVLSESNPENLPWKELNIDVVAECTGAFTDRHGAEKHIIAGAKKVLISAPGKGIDVTIVPGVNDDKLKNNKLISIASCTTNALAPVVKILNDEFKIKKALMTTVHAYTASQNLHDGSKEKKRKGRAGALNLIPTTTGASKAVIDVLPELKGKIDGMAIRAPIAVGSVVDLTAELEKNFTKESINNVFKKHSKKLNGILDYSEEELVSSDIIGNSNSAIIDGLSTMKIGRLVKILAWYDNEYGYSCRFVDVLKRLK